MYCCSAARSSERKQSNPKALPFRGSAFSVDYSPLRGYNVENGQKEVIFMAHDVFVSYHSDSSRAIADRVVQEMERSGVICWYAPRNVQEKYVLDIMDAIQGCSIFVVLLNKAASESEFVLDEIAEAKQSKKKIIVLQLTEEQFSKESSLYLKRHHWVKVGKSLDEAIGELVDRALLNLGREKENKDQTQGGTDTKSEYITLTFCGQIHRVKVDTITYESGSVYLGEVVEGKRHGIGRLTWSKNSKWGGDVYEGEWSHDVRTGKGKYTWANGDVYEGDFVEGKRTGKGKYTWPSGNIYEGGFVDGRKSGSGKFIWTSGDVYVGDFANDKRTGKGKYTWPNGDVYEGDFVDGKRSGYGVFKPAKGKILKGKFENGKFVGK
jgi:hypothetical protein